MPTHAELRIREQQKDEFAKQKDVFAKLKVQRLL